MTDTTPTPEAVERWRKIGEEQAGADFDLIGSMVPCEDGEWVRYEDHLTRVDALTKERDDLEKLWKACSRGNESLKQQTQAARAASGAVAEAMQEAAAGVCRSYSAVHTEFSIGHGQAADNLARRITALPISPDAAAALAEHDLAIWLRVRAILTAPDCIYVDDDLCDVVEAAILARKEG